ncbi:MAG: S49 family peptidase, partial [Bacteroidota bacterium]|nr:S49 family peptidase [Bacteroidota bacterium]
MKFLKYTLATIVGVIIASAIIFFIFLGIVGSMISSGEKETVSISPKTILVMKLDQTIKERTSANPLQNFDFKRFESQTALGLNDILLNIRKAKDDENIKGIFLDLGVIPAGINTIEEIRNALLDFRKSGKFVVAYADYYTQPAYYLATASNKIYLNPAGKLLFLGLKSQITFIKGTLDKLGLEPEIIRHGKFKSAVEPLMMDKMSKENREQVMVYISSIWNHLLEGISAQRKVSIPALNHLADNMTIDDAQSAASHKLVDGTKYKDQVFDELAKLSGQPNADKLNFVNLDKYDNVPMPRKERHVLKNKIAIIYAQGDIVLGEGDDDNIGSEKYAKAIREAR